MKVFLVFLGCVVLSCSAAGVSSLRPHQQRNPLKTHITRLQDVETIGASPDVGCPACVDFAEEVIDILEDIVLNIGILDSCGVLCSVLAQETGQQIVGVVCDILCDIVGVNEFIKAVTKADLDPIYFCELTKSCPIFDQGDVHITKLYVLPVSGPQGVRTIGFTYKSVNGTGTGQRFLNITTVDGMPLASSFLNEQQPPGWYYGAMTLDAEADPTCDPYIENCETWLPGTYVATMAVCNGECFSRHPHSKVYDQKSVEFKITEE